MTKAKTTKQEKYFGFLGTLIKSYLAKTIVTYPIDLQDFVLQMTVNALIMVVLWIISLKVRLTNGPVALDMIILHILIHLTMTITGAFRRKKM